MQQVLQKAVSDAIASQLQIQILPGLQPLIEAHRAAGQQLDNLCGPYWAALLLQAYGNLEVTAEQVGLQAGSVLPKGKPATWLPQGAASRQTYRIPLPKTDQLAVAGTSAIGLVRAVARLSGDRYSLVPLKTDWSAVAVKTILDLCRRHPAWNAIPICNLHTGYLWGATLSLSQVLAYLSGLDLRPPVPDWRVGHFAVLAGTLASAQQTLAIVQDTYPHLGWDGYHLQPLDTIAAALKREDQTGEGGILLFVETAKRAEVERQVQARGFKVAIWDNGTPWLKVHDA